MSNFDWSDIKIFIAAPREMSAKRFTEIVKHYLPKGNIVLGISKEEYVVGFEGQPQFTMLKQGTVQPIIEKIMNSPSPNKIYPYVYSQGDLGSVVNNLRAGQRVLLVNGSWLYAFHNSAVYKLLTENNIPIKFISPFCDEKEAQEYEVLHEPVVDLPQFGDRLDAESMFAAADNAAKQSYDYSFQTGASLGRYGGTFYEFIMTTFNRVIPYQTYALHYGNSRERNLSPPHDTNHYDTIHAEMEVIVEAGRNQINLEGTTLFINLLPCPNCARTLSQTDIDTIVYRNDHSNGYAKELLELCGKKVKKLTEM